jgi:TfoX/Sxy family transcriptional regulator of competence genes
VRQPVHLRLKLAMVITTSWRAASGRPREGIIRPMEWKKTPPELAAAFDRAAPQDPQVVRKPMFGYPALFLNGNMFAGTFQDKIVARLSEPERERAIKAGATRFEPMPGRPMKEYVVVPAADVAKPAALAKWIERARAHARTLPEKKTVKKTTQKATPKKRSRCS